MGHPTEEHSRSTPDGPPGDPDRQVDRRDVQDPGTVRGETPRDERESIPLSLRRELQRKALHLLALVIPGAMFLLGRVAALWLLLPLTVVALTADVLRTRSELFARWIERIFGFMMRPEEKPPIGARPVLNGATWVLVSATLLTIVFPTSLAGAAFAAFMVADAAAAIVGRTLGRTHWGSSPRTLEGSMAFVAAGFMVLLPLADASLGAIVASVLAGAAVEIPRWRLNDNVRVPFVMAIVLTLI